MKPEEYPSETFCKYTNIVTGVLEYFQRDSMTFHHFACFQKIQPNETHRFTSLSRIYLSRIVEKVPKNLSSYAPDQDEGNKQQCN